MAFLLDDEIASRRNCRFLERFILICLLLYAYDFFQTLQRFMFIFYSLLLQETMAAIVFQHTDQTWVMMYTRESRFNTSSTFLVRKFVWIIALISWFMAIFSVAFYVVCIHIKKCANFRTNYLRLNILNKCKNKYNIFSLNIFIYYLFIYYVN